MHLAKKWRWLGTMAAVGIATLSTNKSASAQYNWTATASGNWSLASDWDANGVPISGSTTTLTFAGSAAYTATNDIGSASFTLNQMTISNTADITIASAAPANSLTFAGSNAGLTIAAGAGATTISSNIVYSANTTVTNNSANTLAMTGSHTFNAGTTTTFTGSGSTGLSAGAALTPSLTFLNGASIVYTGSGTLSVGPQAVNGALNNIVFTSGGTYNITNGVLGGSSTGNLSMGDNVSGAANTTILYAPSTNVTLNFANYSSGILSVGNFGEMTGTVNINAGTVRFGIVSGTINTGGNLFGNGQTLNVAAGATFNFNGNGESMGAIAGSGTITGAAVTMEITGNHVWAGVYSGTSAFSTGVAGVFYSFTGNNTSTGTTTIVASSGLTLGGGGASGTVGGAIANAGILNFDRSDNYTFSKVISGAGSVNQIGTGTFTLSATNTYTGNTNVVSGTLAFANAAALPSGTPQVTVSSGAVLNLSAIAGGYSFGTAQTLIVGRSGVPATDVFGAVTIGGTLDLGGLNTIATATFGNGLTLNSSTVKYDLSNSVSTNNDSLIVTGNLTLSGTVSIAVNQTSGSLGTGNYTLMTYSGTLTGNASNLSLSGVTAGTTRQSFNFDTTSTPGSVLLAVTGSPANLTWVGNAANNVWDLVTTANFSGGTIVPPGTTVDNRFYNLDSVKFDATGVGGATAVTLTGNLAPSSVLITGSQSYSFTGSGAITGQTSLTMNGTGTLTIGTANTYTGVTFVNAGILTFASSGTITGNVTVAGGAVQANQAAAISGNITINSGTVTSSSTGALTGNVTINGGTFSISSQLVQSSTSVVTFNGGTMQLTGLYSTGSGIDPWVFSSGGATVDVLLGFGTTQFGAAPAIPAKQGNSISGSGPFVLMSSSGQGAFNIGQSSSTFSGTTTIMAGAVLRFTSNQFSQAGSITVQSGGTYMLYDTTSGPFNLGSGASLILNGNGAPLQGIGYNNSNIGGAFMHVPDPAEGASPFYAFNSPVVLATTSRITELNATSTTGYTISGVPGITTDIFTQQISGPGNLIKDGDGVLVLSNTSTTTPNSYGGSSGTTIVSNGTLQISNGGNTSATIGGGGNNILPITTTLQLGEAGSSNSGTFDLFGNNQTVAGLTTAGTGTANEVINSSTTVASTLTVNFTGSTAQTFAGQLGGGSTGNNFGLTLAGSGTLILTGANTYTGTTAVSAGALYANNTSGSATGTGPVNVGGSSPTTLGGSGFIAGAITLNGNSTPAAAVLAPGANSTSNGVLTGSGGITFGANSVFQWKLGALQDTAGGAVAGTNYDQFSNNGGTITVTSGAVLSPIFLSGVAAPNSGNTFWSVSHTWTGILASSNGGSIAGGSANFTVNNSSWSSVGAFSTAIDGSNYDLTWSPTPEPTSILLLGAAGAGLMGFARRRSRKGA